jgi:hypothetical protein
LFVISLWTTRVRFPGGARFASPLRRPERLWSPNSILYNGYWRLFPRGKSGLGVKLTMHPHLMPRSRMGTLYIYFPILLHE